MAGRSRPAGAESRVFTLEMHRALEAGIGLVLMLVPFALRYGVEDGVDFSGAAIFVCGVIGLGAATLGFSGTRLGSDPSGGSHELFDRILTVALVVSALIFAVSGEAGAALLLAAAGVAYLGLVFFTRYSRRY